MALFISSLQLHTCHGEWIKILFGENLNTHFYQILLHQYTFKFFLVYDLKKTSLTTHWEALKFLREVGFNNLFRERK